MYSVICADDDADILDIYGGVLRSRGYEVRLFPDGNTALKSFREKPADILILDVDMPVKSGVEVCRELRQGADSFTVPIIMVSGRDSEEDIVNGLMAGADDYIVKSFRPPELLAKISAILKKRRSTSRNMGIAVGSIFSGRYKLLSKIGRGGSSNVYYGKDITLDPPTEVAIKIFESTFGNSNNDHFLPLFLREAYGLSKLDHPNIVKLISFGHENLIHYLVMEYVQGLDLATIQRRRGRLPVDAVIAITYQIADALRYLNQERLIHRDVTPKNIIINYDGKAKLVDFGLAKNIDESSITASKNIKGTIHFASPECISGKRRVDIRSDIFSLAATMYAMCTDVLPFDDVDEKEVVKKHLSEVLPSISTQIPEANQSFSDLIDDMLAKKPEDRPTIGDVVSTLGRLSAQTGTNLQSFRKILLPEFF